MKKYLLPLLLIPIALLITLAVSFPARAAIHTEAIAYQQGETVLEGYLAYDEANNKPRPGVLVVHAWKGLGEHEKESARKLAKLGYVALAADIYGKGVRPTTNEEAATQAQIYRSDRQLLRDRANAGVKVLQEHPLTQANKIGAIGYCFGGGTVLELARSGAPVAGVVSFHGNLDTPNPEDANNIQGRVLVLHGADDPFVPNEQVQAFMQEMRDANVDWQLVMYGGTVHSFTHADAGDDPAKGTAYNADADRRSWEAMQDFFAEIFAVNSDQ